MSWIILALTLGAAITSIIHGVFMLFGSLVNTGALFNISTNILASLPVVSAIFALIGGIIAFNKSKWSILFLLIAVGLCVPSKDTWLYGGIYFFTLILCFFLKPDKGDEYQYSFYDDEEEQDPEDISQAQTPQYYLGNESENYSEEEDEVDYLQGGYPTPPADNAAVNEIKIPDPILNGDVKGDINPLVLNPVINVNNEPPKLRRRMSKSCPTCGATVAREAKFCSTCGTALSIPAEDYLLNNLNNNEENETRAGNFESEINFAANINSNVNDGDDEMSSEQAASPKVFVKPKRASSDFSTANGTRQRINSNIDAAASSYQEFSKYTRRAKKRKRSAGRKILSMLLLVGVVGGALYFLLGLRKLPPGDLPPMAQNKVINNSNAVNNDISVSTEQPSPATTAAPVQDSGIATPVAVAENVLPNFTPAREPKRGMVIGSNVNVRADHSTSSNRIARLNVNSRVDIIGNYNVTSGQYQGIWYNVMTDGKEGWIYGRYVQPLGDGLPSGYSNALLKTFGNDKSQLADALGQPKRSSATSAEWDGLTATFKDDELTRLRVTSARRELQNGLKVGMSQTALLQIMGYPSGLSNKILQYNEGGKTGVSVQLDRNNAISVITVNSLQ